MFRNDWGAVGQREIRVQAVDENWIFVVNDICQQAELNVVLPVSDEKGQFITVSFDRVPVVDALRALGALRKMEPVLRNGLVEFETQSVGALGIVVPGFLAATDAAQIAKSVVGSEGGVDQAGPHVVVSGKPEAVERAAKLSEVFASTEPGQWLISMWVIEMNTRLFDKLGVELSISGAVQGTITSGSAAEGIARAVLEGTIDAEHNRGMGRIMNHASVVLVEGSPSSIRNVTSTPIPERTVSPEGTVQTSGYTFIEAGLIVELNGRAVPGGNLFLDVKPELSSITGMVEDAPIIAKRSMQFAAMVSSGEWVIVSGLDQWREIKQKRGLFELASQKEKSSDTVLIVMRASRVARTGMAVGP